METVHEERNKQGLRLRVVYDSDCECPLEYLDGIFIALDIPHCFEWPWKDHKAAVETAREILRGESEEYKEHHCFTVYAYVHSGWAVSLGRESYPFNCPWDSGIAGVIALPHSEFKTREEAAKCADSILSELNSWASGDCYGVIVDDGMGNVIDSCYGFIGHDYALAEGQSILNAASIAEAAKEITEDILLGKGN